MKLLSTLLCAGLLAAAFSAQAQTTPQPVTLQPFVKKIDVTGASELEVVPDRIFFSISLREYFKDRDKDRVDIEGLEKQLVAAVREAGVPKENFQIENIYGNRWQWQNRKKPVDFLESKRYVLELSDLTKIDPILSKVDAKGIEYVTISRYDHTKMEQYRRDLKIKALQAAKEKANYLLQSVGEQPGGVLEIQEIGDNIYYPQPYEASNMRMKSMEMAQDAGAAAGGADTDIGFKKIKLRYEMRASFAIK